MALTGNLTGSLSTSMSAEGGVNGLINFDGSGTDNYNELDNKPSINGVILQGNKTSSDLNIETGGTDNYNDLLNKPKINGTTLTGDVSDEQLLIDYNHLINKPVIPDIAEIETRLDTAETDIDNINDDIATIKATDLTQNADINSLKNRVTGTETNISNLTTRVSSAENIITTQGTQISSIEDDVTGLDTRVGTAEGDIDTLRGDMTQAQSDISELNSSLNVIGNYYTMRWTATSSNASDTQLTNKTNLPRGTYIAIGSAPVPSVKDFPISLACSGSNNTVPYFNGIRDRSIIAFIVQINDNTADVWLKTASSNSCTYTNIDQSAIRFIRIS